MSKEYRLPASTECTGEAKFKAILTAALRRFLETEKRYIGAIDMTLGDLEYRKQTFADVCECMADCYAAGVKDMDGLLLKIVAEQAEKYPGLAGGDGGTRLALYLSSKTCELISQRSVSGSIILDRVRGEAGEIKGKVDKLVAELEEDLS